MGIDFLIKKASRSLKKSDIKKIIKAYNFAEKAHKKQFRASGKPYITHSLAAADILLDYLPNPTLLEAALLHDVIEDCRIGYDDIRQEFGKEVADIVDGVTKISSFKFGSYEESQAENFRKIILAMSQDIRVILVKIADRLHNMRTLQYLPPAKQVKIARTTLEIYAPIANRLGLGKIKEELEDLSFKYLYQHKYYDLLNKLNRRSVSVEEYRNGIIKIIEQKIRENKIKAVVTGRAKHLYSIFLKMQRGYKPFDEIYDIAGVRIITKNIRDCYGVLGLVHSLWRPVPGRIKDYIAMPKSNMYQSIHTTVVGPKGEYVEVQIRTEEMHRVAEKGIAAHWLYKERIPQEQLEKRFSWIKNIIDWQDSYKDPKEFMEALKMDIFPDKVFVFTPKGDVKELPRGSTPIDFAYAIHSEVGDSCVGAKITGKIVPLNYKLKTGDILEIITLKGHKPGSDWLKTARTPRAINKIRQFIKQKQNRENIIIGRNILEDKLKSQSINLSNIEKKDYFKKLFAYYNFKEMDELYFAIGSAKLSVNVVIKNILKNEKPRDRQLPAEHTKKTSNKSVIVANIDNMEIRFANCCNAIPDDDIVGYVTRGRGVTIHKAACKNLQMLLKNKERILPANWNLSAKVRFGASIVVKALDREGLLADVAGILKNLNINIIKADVFSDSSLNARINLRVEVTDLDQIKAALVKINELKNVIRVIRK